MEDKETEKENVQEQGKELPEINFSMFLLSLSTSTLVSLGMVENPVSKKTEKDLASARQTIDLIAMLQQKTKGNLTDDESKLMEDILHELRVWYCKAAI